MLVYKKYGCLEILAGKNWCQRSKIFGVKNGVKNLIFSVKK